MANCDECGKILRKDGCPYYCSKECCDAAIDRMVCVYGGTFEAAEAEVIECCGGECVC